MRPATDYPDPKLISKMLEYHPETGRLFWRERTPDMFGDGDGWQSAASRSKRWNKIYAGKETGLNIGTSGYISVTILGKSRQAHRLIWAIQTGCWPKDQIDHINQDRTDNRWENLRQCDNSENCRNQRLPKNNKSGHAGVWETPHGTWQAFIRKDGKQVSLGTHKKIEDAIAAREAAKTRLGYNANHGVANVS